MWKNKKAQRFEYIVFVALFITILTIFTGLLGETVVNETNTEDQNFFESLLSMASNAISRIPIIGDFYELVLTSRSWFNTHEYVRDVMIILLTVPFGYIMLRIIRGGG